MFTQDDSKEIKVKTALHKIADDDFPYQRDLNIYRGCFHHCQYCYAMYSHKYLEQKNFFGNVFVKTNIVEVLEKKLKSKSRNHATINLGGVTDSYQHPMESKYQIMPQILKLFIKYRQSCTISTKSDLILRDIDLWDELASLTYANIGVSVITTNNELASRLEPGAPSPERRLKILQEFSKTKVNTGWHCMPVLPFLTDSENNLEKLIYYAKKFNVNYFLASGLRLCGDTKKNFFEFVKSVYPEKLEKLKKLYKTGMYVDEKYSETLRNLIKKLKFKHELHRRTKEFNFNSIEKPKKQISLFEVIGN